MHLRAVVRKHASRCSRRRKRRDGESGSRFFPALVMITLVPASVTGQPLPEAPYALTAVALCNSEIRLTWQMPSEPRENGFEIEYSLTGDEADFRRSSPNPRYGARDHVVEGLPTGSGFWFRLRAVNVSGCSGYSNTAYAATPRLPFSRQLSTAMMKIETMNQGLERLIETGDEDMEEIRILLGDFPHGYDASPMKALVESWRAAYPDDQAQASLALARGMFLQQAMESGFIENRYTPPMHAAWEISAQAAEAAGVLTKDLCAFALAWKRQQCLSTQPDIILVLEDVIAALSDVLNILLVLTGANDDGDLARFTAEVLRTKTGSGGLTARQLLTVPAYWQARMAGRAYISATQPMITTAAGMCEALDFSGSRHAAREKYDLFAINLRAIVTKWTEAYQPYHERCLALDCADDIAGLPSSSVDTLLQRLMTMRLQLIEGLHTVMSDVIIPVQRFLLLNEHRCFPDLEPLPTLLFEAGDAIYHPDVPGAPALVSNASEGSDTRATRQHGCPTATADFTDAAPVTDPSPVTEHALVGDPAIEADRVALITLRGKVLAGDANHTATAFETLRGSAREMVAAIARRERRLFGIAPSDMYRQTELRDRYYGTIARAVLLKTRRSMLSVALAEYALAPAETKQSALAAEIDSILESIDGVLVGLADLESSQAASLITLPVLVIRNAEIVHDGRAGRNRYRLRFVIRNAGGAVAMFPHAELSVLTRSVTTIGPTTFRFADLAPSSWVGDSLSFELPEGTASVSFDVILGCDGSVFTERRTLAVPQPTTDIGHETPIPASCLLHQNHPNPFNSSTTISFTLSDATPVALVVTDMLGREVARLVDGEQFVKGEHYVNFDARELPSGMYLYRLEAGGAVMVRKMVLMR